MWWVGIWTGVSLPPKLVISVHQSSLMAQKCSLFLGGGLHIGIWRFSGEESNQSYSCQPVPQPQQCGIQVTSASYTTVRSSARSLTHWARPGIEPAICWFLVKFVSAAPWQELPPNCSWSFSPYTWPDEYLKEHFFIKKKKSFCFNAKFKVLNNFSWAYMSSRSPSF